MMAKNKPGSILYALGMTQHTTGVQGIRSFTTTTGAWVRGILANDYGVDLDSIDWVSFEEPHVAEYIDSTERAAPGKNIIQMLLDGELDAVIGEVSDDPRLRSLFADPKAEEKIWFARHGVVPVNHFVVVSSKLAASEPDAVREVFRMLKASKQAAPASAAPDPFPFGVENFRRSLELIIAYAAQQSRFTISPISATWKCSRRNPMRA